MLLLSNKRKVLLNIHFVLIFSLVNIKFKDIGTFFFCLNPRTIETLTVTKNTVYTGGLSDSTSTRIPNI